MTHLMKQLSIALLSVGVLTACGGEPTAEEVKDTAAKVEAKAEANLDTMSPVEMADYMSEQGKSLTLTLRGITDKASAEAALPEIRAVIPKVKAAADSFENMDQSKIGMNLKLMKKMPEVAQVQLGLMSEMIRVSQIPEAAEVLEAEFDKLDF